MCSKKVHCAQVASLLTSPKPAANTLTKALATDSPRPATGNRRRANTLMSPVISLYCVVCKVFLISPSHCYRCCSCCCRRFVFTLNVSVHLCIALQLIQVQFCVCFVFFFSKKKSYLNFSSSSQLTLSIFACTQHVQNQHCCYHIRHSHL